MNEEKKETPKLFFASQVGCFIDGALGQEHAVEKMVSMLETIKHASKETDRAETIQELFDDLELMDSEYWDRDEEVIRNTPDTRSFDEWLDSATEILQEVTEDGYVWFWEAGDLILTDSKEAE